MWAVALVVQHPLKILLSICSIVIYIFYVCQFLVSSKQKKEYSRIRTHVHSNTANLVLATSRSHYTNGVFLEAITI